MTMTESSACSSLDEHDRLLTGGGVRRGRVWKAPVAPRAEFPRRRGATAIALGTAAALAVGGTLIAQIDGPSPVERPVVSMNEVIDQVNARTLWAQGITGEGVAVAVIDTGVAPVDALADQLVASADFSSDAEVSGALADGFGHGTHMAGIVAGRDLAVDQAHSAGPDDFVGVAPGADIVSVKVAGADGVVAPGSLLAGIDWAVTNADELGIGVIHLALDSDTGLPYEADPVAAALERAWDAGIVVVTAAGNGGALTDGLNSPAHDPFVISVGGLESAGSGFRVPDWASRGNADRRPDLAAPGAHVASLRAPLSDADLNHPGGYLDEQLFLGSGSSQSAAVVSGVVALIRSAQPSLSPDEVKAALVRSARPVSANADFVGSGLVDAAAALSADVSDARQTWIRSSGVAADVGPDGQLAFGSAWMGNAWMGNAWMGNAWMGNAWMGNAWMGNAWMGNAWMGNAWMGNAWMGNAWMGNAWMGDAWMGNAWMGNAWMGNAWMGNAWM